MKIGRRFYEISTIHPHLIFLLLLITLGDIEMVFSVRDLPLRRVVEMVTHIKRSEVWISIDWYSPGKQHDIDLKMSVLKKSAVNKIHISGGI
jgi:hypothetical protein